MAQQTPYQKVNIVDANGDLVSLGSGSGGGTTDVSALLKEGTPINGETLETGGSSGIGWFSSLRKAVTSFAANFGLTSDSVAASPTSGGSYLSLFKFLLQLIDNRLPSTLVSDRLKVDVSFPTSQAVSATSLPLPTGASTDSTLAEVRDRLMPSTGITFTHILANTSSGFLKASPGNLYTLSCINMGTAKKYLQVFNKTTAPTGADTPVRVFPVPAGDNSQDGFLFIRQQEVGGGGIPLAAGIAWGISTTATTFTAATASETILGFRWT